EPLRTQVAQVKGGHFAMVAAHMTAFGQNAAGSSPDQPTQTVLARAARHGVVAAFFEQANGGYYKGDGRSAYDPISTI
ncbi:DNA cytosine methyltransferase, partial [Pseudomonas sp. SIMBA_044]